jgi:alpha-1,2-mannosyltransferase
MDNVDYPANWMNSTTSRWMSATPEGRAGRPASLTCGGFAVVCLVVRLPRMVSLNPLALLPRRLAGPVLLVFAVSAITVVCWLFGLHVGLDSSVYRSGAAAVLRGESLYGRLAGASGLPFIYPPIAAIVFAPLALLPWLVGWGLVAVLRVSVVAGAGVGGRGWPGWLGPSVLAVGVLVLEPVWLTLDLGQVNVLLMALVVVDVLGLRRSSCRGVLVGLAAAVKLTPLVFVPFLLLAGRRGDAGRALGVFVGLNVVGWVLLPGDTVRFWRSQVLGGVGVTSNSWYGNQSLNGVVQRLSHHAGWAFGVAVVAGVVCVGVGLLLGRRLWARGDELGGLLVVGFAGTLASPISWTHHWVWVVPLVVLLVRRGWWWVLAGAVVVFSGWSFLLVPTANGGELGWTPVQMLLGNAYVVVGLVAGVVLCWWEVRGGWRPWVGVLGWFGRFRIRRRTRRLGLGRVGRVWPVGDRRGF